MINQYQLVLDDICDKLEDNTGLHSYASDLHHYLCNQDYFIIGTYKAEKFLGDNAFEAIGMVQDYEQSNFGEVTTDLSDPEKVVNMFAYIVGEQILAESDHLQGCWDRTLLEEDIKKIYSEICTINATKLYREAA